VTETATGEENWHIGRGMGVGIAKVGTV
jgi:hypothetical protein